MQPVARRAGALKRFLEARDGSLAVAYVDTSSLVAIGFDEPGGQEMAEELAGYTRLVSSNLLEAELRATRRSPDKSFGQVAWRTTPALYAHLDEASLA